MVILDDEVQDIERELEASKREYKTLAITHKRDVKVLQDKNEELDFELKKVK